MAEELNKRKIQLNEKVDADGNYDVLYPETIAEQVIENDGKQFVTKAEKDKWNELIGASPEQLSYKGQYTSGTSYKKNDVVHYSIDSNPNKFYICIAENGTSLAPTNINSWIGLNEFAELAKKSDLVKLNSSTGDTGYNLIVFKDNADGIGYEELSYSNMTYVPSTNVLTIGNVIIDGNNGTIKGNLIGNADTATTADVANKAISYVQYNSDKNDDGTYPKIDDTIKRLEESIRNVSGGGVKLKTLTITKDGKATSPETKYDGSTDVSLDIKQTYVPEDITGLLSGQKIDNKWLPDSILGQLEYIGTWDPNPTNPAVDNSKRVKGHYYIAKGAGRFLPDGSTLPTNESDFQTGDWAVYNGTSWDKVDNTDAVTKVNSQIGAIETYKGEYVAGTKYYKGDIVSFPNKEGALYLCISEVQGTNPTNESGANYWKIFGKIYSASDGIKLDGDTFKHDVTIIPNTTDNGSQVLKPNENFSVYELVRDDYGHVTEIKQKLISLSSDFVDTVRPIAIASSDSDTVVSILDSTEKSTLHFYSSDKIGLRARTAGNKGIQILHNEPVESTSDKDLTHSGGTIGAGGTIKVPSLKVDSTGHITVGELKEYTVGLADIAHNHFAITTDGNTKTIGAYTAEDYGKLATKDLKFYLGSEAPTSTSQMNFNGYFNATKLLQGNNSVLDSSSKIISGFKYDGSKIESTYNNGEVILGESGVIVPDKINGKDNYSATYSAVAVNKQGIVTAGGQIVEFGTEGQTAPSVDLVVGGLFFRHMGAVTA